MSKLEAVVVQLVGLMVQGRLAACIPSSITSGRRKKRECGRYGAEVGVVGMV